MSPVFDSNPYLPQPPLRVPEGALVVTATQAFVRLPDGAVVTFDYLPAELSQPRAQRWDLGPYSTRWHSAA